MTTIVSTVFCTLSFEGVHFWGTCPFDEVAYLRDPHRHVFNVKAHKLVSHDDRDTEFIILKHKIANYLRGAYWDNTIQMHNIGPQSCEMIARSLIEKFGLCECSVDEDGENGATLRVV